MDNRERLNDSEEGLRNIIEEYLASSWHALPCIIEKLNFTGEKRFTLDAQPAVRMRWRNPQGVYVFVTPPLLVDVPVIFPSGGGFTLTFPLEKGDECLVVFSDRCIDGWWQNGNVQNPPEIRLHDLSDGFAIPGPRSKPRAFDIASDKVELRNDSGSVKLTLDDQLVKVSAPNVHAHAAVSYAWDVHGYGERVTWLGDNNYQIDNYKTGAVVTTNNHPINPPEIP